MVEETAPGPSSRVSDCIIKILVSTNYQSHGDIYISVYYINVEFHYVLFIH